MNLGILKNHDALTEALTAFRKAKGYGGHDTPEALLGHVMPLLIAFRDELKDPLAYTDFNDEMEALIDGVKFGLEDEIEEARNAGPPKEDYSHERGAA